MDQLDKMRAIWDHSLDGIVIADANTRILDVNPAYCQLSGYSREQLIGQRTSFIGSGLTPRSTFTEMWQSLSTHGRWVGELINKKPDGTTWISFLSITRVCDRPNEQPAYVGIARDLTTKHQLETDLRLQSTRLTSLLAAITTGVAMFGLDDRCVVANLALSQLLDSPISALIGCSRGALQEQFDLLFKESALLSPTDPNGTRTACSRGLRPRWFNVRWGPVRSDSGDPLGHIFTFREITRETEVDRMKSDFIATVSHELRTPMTSVKGALSLLLGGAAGDIPDRQYELLSIAQKNVDRLIRLVNDILDLSRIESGRLELRCVPLNINEAVTAAVQELEAVRQERRLHVQTDLSLDLPLAEADPDRISQVLVNLLGNAYKFTDPGDTISVQTGMLKGMVSVSIKDNGPGIASTQLDSIFERFYRASGPVSIKAGGTGLGLAIARAIITEHQGEIWAENRCGRGATFTFTLPVRSALFP